MSAIAGELPGARVLDLFAGSGALGLEALSRGAREVTFVEQAASARKALEVNIARLRPPANAVRVVRRDALRFIEGLAAHEYDIAFADPPYRLGAVERLEAAHAQTPFARLLCIEHSRDEPLTSERIVRQRRYGDTMLTFIAAEDVD